MSGVVLKPPPHLGHEFNAVRMIAVDCQKCGRPHTVPEPDFRAVEITCTCKARICLSPDGS